MVDQEEQKGKGAGEDPSHDHDADCTDAVARLYEFLDGELDGATMKLVREHLEHCSPCLEAFDFHAELRAVVKEKCSEPMPADVRQKLLALLDQSGPGCTPG
jgi:mycothiol system anti-sigma-R factor